MQASEQRPLDEHPTVHTPEGKPPSPTGVGATPDLEPAKKRPADPRPQRIWAYVAYGAIALGLLLYAILVA